MVQDHVQKIVNAERKSIKIIKNIFDILETFLKKNGFICYGGTAINNILPTHAQFYNKSIELQEVKDSTPHSMWNKELEMLKKELIRTTPSM